MMFSQTCSLIVLVHSFNKTMLLLCAGHCIGAGDSKISKNRHNPCIYRIYSLA